MRTFAALLVLVVLSVAPVAGAQTSSPGPAPEAAPSQRPAAPAQPASSPTQGTQPPNVTLPVLTYREPVIYPPDAERQGVEGTVVLALTIEADGSVSKVDVVEPAGYGFDEAARAAAEKFRFTPAMRDGVPVRVKIPYRQSFTKPVVTSPPPALPVVGDLGGRLLLSGAEVPLSGISIVATAANGTTFDVISDAEGKWSLLGLAPGVYKIKIEASGFASVEFEEEVVAGKETLATYRLAPDSGGLEVTVTGQRPPREVTRRTIERREIARVPGTGGDALRSLQSLPGVARPPGLAGLLIVRGSAPEDTLTFVDGVDVPLIYHFGGLSSVVPTELLDKIDFYPGNFSSRYGRVTGGIVDVGLRAPNTQCTGDYGKPLDKYDCYHGLFQFDLIDTRAMVQGPIGPAKDWSFALAGRRSWVDAWLTPTLKASGAGVTSAPVYYDYQLIAEYHPRKDERLSLRFFGSDDRLELIIKDPLAEDPGFVGGNLRFRTGFYRAQAFYSVALARNVDLETTLSVGKDRIEFSLGQLAFKVDANVILSRSELGFKLTKGLKLNLGLDYAAAPYDLLVRAPEPPRPGEPSAGPFTTRPILEQRDHGLVFRPAWYGEAEVKPTRALLVVPGMRIDYARDSGHSDWSPRINARYDLIGGANVADDALDKPRRTTVKGGVGLFHQPPQFQETDTVFGTPGLESNRSIHYTVGVEQELTDQVEVSVEGYYKDMGNLVSRTPDETGEYTYNNAGSGYVIGAETLLKYKPDSRFFGWLAYTLSRSVRKNGPGEASYLFQYDQTHILTVLGSYRLGRGWEAGARFRLVSGPLATPVQGQPGLPALYAADAAAYTPLEGKQFSERLPLFHQLDIRIDKSWQFRDWRLSAFLDIWNTYNNPAVEALGYNFDFSQRSYQTGLPIIPSMGMRGEF